MPGVKGLRQLRLGKETTAGTAVAPTTIWRGEGVLDDDLKVVFPQEDVGYLPDLDRKYIPSKHAKLALTSTPCTFEQFPYVLAMGVKNVTTGASDGAGTDKIYAYGFATTAQPVTNNYTIEGGDDQAGDQERMEYCFAAGFELSFKAEEAVMLKADLEGRQVAINAFSGSPTIPSVEEMLTSLGKLYIDVIGGTIGTTQKTNTLLEGVLKVKTGLIPVFTADGNLFFSFTKAVTPEVTLDLTFEHDGTAQAEKVAWRAGTSRLLQLKFEGSAVATPGTLYSKRTCLINLAGSWENFTAMKESNGNDVVTGTFRARYNTTAAQFATITVVNELTTLP